MIITSWTMWQILLNNHTSQISLLALIITSWTIWQIFLNNHTIQISFPRTWGLCTFHTHTHTHTHTIQQLRRQHYHKRFNPFFLCKSEKIPHRNKANESSNPHGSRTISQAMHWIFYRPITMTTPQIYYKRASNIWPHLSVALYDKWATIGNVLFLNKVIYKSNINFWEKPVICRFHWIFT